MSRRQRKDLIDDEEEEGIEIGHVVSEQHQPSSSSPARPDEEDKNKNDGDDDDDDNADDDNKQQQQQQQQHQRSTKKETEMNFSTDQFAQVVSEVKAEIKKEEPESRHIVIHGVDFLVTDVHLHEIVATILGPERMVTKPLQLIKRRSVVIEMEHENTKNNEVEGGGGGGGGEAAKTTKKTVTLPTEDVEVHFLKARDARTVKESLHGGSVNGRAVTVGVI